jgi:protein-L-isoaspartate(D-aspartate) O-methyltransferase
VHTKIGDGYLGWAEHAPFDKMIVTCSPENVPQPLIDQLVEGGQMIVPIGERFQQTLCRFTKRDGKLEREPLQATFFVPMTGESEEQREVKPDKTRPELAHGGFEETLGDSQDPMGWYYLRQGVVTPDADAPEGTRVLVFENTTPGRSAHALQSFGIDGTAVRQMELRFWVRGRQLPSRRAEEAPRVFVEFYNENRAPVGRANAGPFIGTFDWREMSRTIPVPPTAQLGVVGIGLFGSTGQLAFDQVTIEAK